MSSILGHRGLLMWAITVGGGSGLDPDTIQIVNDMNHMPLVSTITAINNAVLQLKADGLWNKADSIQFRAAETIADGFIDWKRHGISGNWANAEGLLDYTVGLYDNGQSSNYSPTTDAVNYSLNSASIAVMLVDYVSGFWLLETGDSFVGATSIWWENGDTTIRWGIHYPDSDILTANIYTVPSGNPNGLWLMNRSSSTATQLYRDGVLVDTGTDTSLELPTGSLTTNSQVNGSSLLTGTSAFFWAGASLDSTEVAALSNIVATYISEIYQAVKPSRYFALSQSNTAKMQIWDAVTGIQETLPGPITSNVNLNNSKLSWNVGESKLLAANVGPLNVLSVPTDIDNPIWTINTISIPVGSIVNEAAWDVNFGIIAASDQVNDKILLFDANTYAQLTSPPALPATATECLTWSPDGFYLVLGGTWPTNLTIYLVMSPDPLDWTQETPPAVMPNGNVRSVAYSPDGAYLAVASDEPDGLFVYDTSTWTKVVSLDLVSAGAVNRVKFSPDGTKLAVAYQSSSEKIKVFDTTTWSEIAFPVAPPTRGGWSDISFNKQGTLVTFICSDAGVGGRFTYQTSDLTLVADLSPAPQAANLKGCSYS